MEEVNTYFSETSLQWGLLLILLIAVVYGLRAWRGYARLKPEAAADYDYKMKEGMLPATVQREQYIRSYRRVHAPRASAYIAATLCAIVVLTLPALGLLYWITFVLWEMGGKDKVFAPGLIVHSMLMFFLIISFWALIAYVAARLYHGNTALSLEAELNREIA